ncbi:hypothetical protein [Streptomyces sp. NPDC058579]
MGTTPTGPHPAPLLHSGTGTLREIRGERRMPGFLNLGRHESRH